MRILKIAVHILFLALFLADARTAADSFEPTILAPSRRLASSGPSPPVKPSPPAHPPASKPHKIRRQSTMKVRPVLSPTLVCVPVQVVLGQQGHGMNTCRYGVLVDIISVAAILGVLLLILGRNKVLTASASTIAVILLCPMCTAYQQFELKYSSGESCQGYAIAAIPMGGGYFVGAKFTSAGVTYAWILRLNVDGVIMAENKEICVAAGGGLDLKYTSDGGCIFTAGKYDSGCTGGTVRPFVYKMDSSLAVQASQCAYGISGYAYAITLLSTGSYIVVGANSGFVVMLDSGLGISWSRGTGSNENYDVTELQGLSQVAVLGKYYMGANYYVRYEIWTFAGSIVKSCYIGIAGTGLRRGFYLDANNVAVGGSDASSGVQNSWFFEWSVDGTTYSPTGYSSGTGPSEILNMKKVYDDRIALLGYTAGSGARGMDVWIRFIDLSGGMQWEWTFGCSGDDVGYGLDVTNDGAVAIAGTYHDVVVGSDQLYVIIKGYKCQPGMHLVTATFMCQNCAKGTYQPKYARASCILCSSGQYQDEEGQPACKYCPPGKFQSAYGQESCNDCDLMKYQDQSGRSYCKTCPSSMYQDEMGQITCKSCIPNCISCTTGSNCYTCVLGYFMFNYGGVVACENPCRDQYYGYSPESKCKRNPSILP